MNKFVAILTILATSAFLSCGCASQAQTSSTENVGPESGTVTTIMTTTESSTSTKRPPRVTIATTTAATVLTMPKEPIVIDKLETIKISELQSDTDAAISEMRSLFKFRDGDMKVELPGELYECSFIQRGGVEKRYEEVFSRLYDKDIFSKVTILNDDWVENKGVPLTSTDKIYTTPTRGFRSDVLSEHCFLHGSGFLCFIRPSAYRDPNGGNTVKIFFADRGDDLSKRYELDGGSMTIAEAVDFAQKWVDENYAYLEPQYTFKVKDVIVRRTSSGDICYDIDVEKSYNGIHLNSAVTVEEFDGTDTIYNDMKMKHITNTLMLQIRKPGEISMFTNGSGMVVPTETKKIDEIISLSSLLPYFKEEFSDALKFAEISEIGLKYTLSPEYDYQNFESYFHPGININSRLVWEILVDIPVNKRSDGHKDMGRMVHYIQVDALTGEVEYDFDPNTN